MKILHRYILKEFSRFFAITLSAFLVLFLIGDFIEKVDDFVEHKARAVDVIRYMLYELPNTAFMVMPLAVLLSTLLALGLLSKNGEIIAMKSGGLPLYKIVAPIFITAAALSGLIFWANETVIPYCNSEAGYINQVQIDKKPARPALKHNKFWFRGPGGEVINIGLVDFKSGIPVCYGITFYKLDKNFGLYQRVDSEKMDWEQGGWVLLKGITYDFKPGGGITMSHFDRLPVNMPEKPEDFKRVERLSQEMDFSELQSYIARLRREGYNPVKYLVDLYGKVSFTLANLIMVIVAVPFSLKTSRSGGMALGVAICIILAISYWFLYSFSISLGHAGRFPPLCAAWFANALFCASGVYMYLQADK